MKILPADIDHDQLIAIMRGFSGALGVRCTHCHVGQEGDPRSMDFASDDKDEKKSARDMLKMTEGINGDYIAKISGNDPTANVMCVTCHRGMALLDSGDLAGAKTQFDRALQIDPKNGAAQQGLKRLEGPPAAKP